MAEPITQYATEEQLADYGGLRRVFDDPAITAELRALMIDTASREADGYIGSQYSLPLVATGPDLAMKVSWMAAYHLMNHLGYAPDAGQDNVFRQRYLDALKWLRDVQGGLSPVGMAGSETGVSDGQALSARPVVITASSRGYSARGDGTAAVFDMVRNRGFTGD